MAWYDTAAGAAGVSAGGSMLGDIFGLFTKKSDRRWNEKQSELAFQRDQQQIAEKRAYESPEAQMKRLKEAGLNPHLMYGQGTTGATAAPAEYQPADAGDKADFSNPAAEGVRSYQAVTQSSIQKQMLEEQRQNFKEQRNLWRAQAFKTLTEGSQIPLDFQQRLKEFGHKKGYDTAFKDIALADEKRRSELHKYSLDAAALENEATAAETQRTLMQTIEIEAKIDNVKASTKLLDKQRGKIDVDNLYTSMKTAREQGLTEQDAWKTYKEILEAELLEAGHTPGTPPWTKIFNEFMLIKSNYGKDAKNYKPNR